MAQLVKIEPGDILVLSNIGFHDDVEMEVFRSHVEALRDLIGFSQVLVFTGDVDLSALPAGWTPDAVAGR